MNGFIDPRVVLNNFSLTEGMAVADLGTGSGHYALEMARQVGADGRVYAIDVQKDLLDRVKDSAAQEKLFNIEVVWGDIDNLGGTRLRDSMIDRAVASNVFFQLEERENFCREVYRILKRTGEVLVIDWSESFGHTGPEPSAIVPEFEVKNIFEQQGFTFAHKIDAGAHHYGLVFKKI